MVLPFRCFSPGFFPIHLSTPECHHTFVAGLVGCCYLAMLFLFVSVRFLVQDNFYSRSLFMFVAMSLSKCTRLA